VPGPIRYFKVPGPIRYFKVPGPIYLGADMFVVSNISAPKYIGPGTLKY
jgi:hypothetical protein